MLFDENFVLTEMTRLARFKQSVADSSALIVMEQLDLLEPARQSLRLLTISEVMTEWRHGSPQAPDLSLLEALATPDYANLITDRKLVAQARHHRLPLFSEDRRILSAAEEEGIPSLCALFMLIRLFGEGRLGQNGLSRSRQILASEYHYDRRRLDLFDQMVMIFVKNGRFLPGD